MLSSQTVNKFETPTNKQNIIPSTSTIKNQNKYNIIFKKSKVKLTYFTTI